MLPSAFRLATAAAIVAFASTVVGAHAQTQAASTLSMPPGSDDMPLADYLGLLSQIAPAAEHGARTYLQAYQQRCARPLPSAELRQAMSDGEGDPVLMAMIRASHLRDATALARLGQQIRCERRSGR
jgi:hypothetical protein